MRARSYLRLSIGPPALTGRCLGKAFSRGLVAAPRRTMAIDSIDIELHSGELVGLVGDAGAGKTTLLQCLSGLLRPDNGYVKLLGENVEDGLCATAIAYVPAVPVYYPFLTPRDVLELRVSRDAVPPRRNAIDRVLDALDLTRLDRCCMSSLPRDVVRRVAVCEALVSEPAVVLVDSCGSQLTSPFPSPALAALTAAADAGAAVLVASREASAVAFVASRMVLLDNGRLTRTFAVESLGEPIVDVTGGQPGRLVAERVH